MRLWIILVSVGDRTIKLCIDETGDEKKGTATDYVAKQYIGNLGKLLMVLFPLMPMDY